MGVRSHVLLLTNCGSAPYEVDGYPDLRLLDAERQPLEVAVVQGSGIVEDPGPTPLVVAPGEAVAASLSWRNRVEGVDPPPVTSGYVAVTVSPGEPAQVIDKQVDIGTTGRVEITSWQRR